MISRGTLGFTLLLSIAIGSWYIARSLQKDSADVQTTELARSGFYLRSARILGTSDDGRLLYEIEAEYAEQQDDHAVEFQNVEINYTSEAAVPWTLNADRAVISDNGDDQSHVTLTGHVVATSSEGFSGDVTEIRTDYLELEPHIFRAQTDERVQIRIGPRSLTATGMLALLQSNQLQLMSNVSGKFVP